jgi:hypothetical protein
MHEDSLFSLNMDLVLILGRRDADLLFLHRKCQILVMSLSPKHVLLHPLLPPDLISSVRLLI